jgi:hypothetical protein
MFPRIPGPNSTERGCIGITTVSKDSKAMALKDTVISEGN